MSLTSAAEAERRADRLRQDLTHTLDQIVDNLTPANLAAEAMAVTRAHTPDWARKYWAFARSPTGLALIGSTLALSLVGRVKARRRRAF